MADGTREGGGEAAALAAAVRAGMENLGVDVDVYSEYVLGILDEASSSPSEKRVAIAECLQDVLEEAGTAEGGKENLTAFAAKVVALWVQTEESRAARTAALTSGEEKLRAALALECARPPPAPGADKPVDAKDAKAKMRTLQQFAIEFTPTVEFGEDGQQLPGGSPARAAAKGDEDEDLKNDNRTRVKDYERAQKDKAKTEHNQEVLRRQELKQKETQKKEKEKQRVAKKERRSGR
eukprot:GHVT01010750.1.p1 GENE.GHVT01010750.1~~GHVT01010750.1.p1  ORF type:complete len:237 (+),score=94.38 GHVT01010750.1:540-1250(+)